jgi:hypothetical protein
MKCPPAVSYNVWGEGRGRKTVIGMAMNSFGKMLSLLLYYLSFSISISIYRVSVLCSVPPNSPKKKL